MRFDIHKCDRCGAIFKADDDYTRSVLIDSGPGYKYYEHYFICPECKSSDIYQFDVPYDSCEELVDDGECEGDCENCKYAKEKENEEVQD